MRVLIKIKFYNILSKSKEKRVTFSSITKKEVLDAIAKPKDLDMDMFYAYQARSVIDKLIGYSVSPLLHKQQQELQQLNLVSLL